MIITGIVLCKRMENPIDSKSHISLWWLMTVLSWLFLIGYFIWTFARGSFFRPFFYSPLWLGQSLVVLGGLLNGYHYYLLKRQNEGLAPPRELVVTGGLFPYLRHPMYLGEMIVMMGFFLMVRDLLSLAVLIVGWLSLVFQARREDGILAVDFPEEHEKWRKRSGLLFPSGLKKGKIRGKREKNGEKFNL